MLLQRLTTALSSRLRSRRFLVRAAAVLVAAAAVGYLGGRQAWAWYHFREAGRDLTRRQPEAAARHLDRTLRVWPGSVEARRLAARAARQSGDLEAARQHLALAQRAEGEPSEETLLEWALLQAEGGDLSRVEDSLRAKAMGRHPAAILIYEAMARAYLKRLRLAECLAILAEWLERHPDDPVAHSTRGQVLNQLRVFGHAAEEFGTAVQLDPDRDDDRLRLSLALIEVGRSEEAVPHLERLRAKDPDGLDLAVYLAFALGQAGSGNEAVRLLDGVLAQDPNHLPALAGHARVDLEAGRDTDAERYARRVLELNPYHRQAAYLLHQSLVAQGRDTDAAAAKARLLELDELLLRYYDIANRYLPQRPEDPELMYQLGEVLVGLGLRAEAAAWWENALRQSPDHVKAHKALADYYASVGQPDRAAEHRRLAGPGGT